MYRIDSAGHKDNRFTDGDLGNGEDATVVPAEWLNTIQEELAAVVEQWIPEGLDKAQKNLVAQSLMRALATKAALNHGHSIGGIAGLSEALADLSSTLSQKGLKNINSGSGTGWWKCGETGLIRQRGLFAVTNQPQAVVEGATAFPAVFPDQCYNVQLTLMNMDSTPLGGAITLRGFPLRNSFDWRLNKLGTSSGTYRCYFVAEGI